MATAITTLHAHANTQPQTRARQSNAPITGFLRDLAFDLRTTVAQMQGKVQSDLFSKHLLALANCYLALIVLLLAAMVPFLYLVNYSW